MLPSEESWSPRSHPRPFAWLPRSYWMGLLAGAGLGLSFLAGEGLRASLLVGGWLGTTGLGWRQLPTLWLGMLSGLVLPFAFRPESYGLELVGYPLVMLAGRVFLSPLLLTHGLRPDEPGAMRPLQADSRSRPGRTGRNAPTSSCLTV